MKNVYTIVLIFFIPICFVCDILFGSVHIPFDAFVDVLSGKGENELWYNIITRLRLPRATAAILVGTALPVSGLLMQTLFRNPLADPYILGISTGASLGVAVFSLAGGISLGLFPTLWGSLGTAGAALIGAALIMTVILVMAPHIHDTVTLLIIGIMFGSITSAIVNVLQYFAHPDEVHSFLLWTMGSLANISNNELIIMAGFVFPAIICSLFINKQLDAILLGENYAFALGVNIQRLRIVIIVLSAILAGIVTAFAGPIGFVGMTIPHVARFLFKTNSHKVLIINSILIGVNLMLICDMIAQLPGMQAILPINTVTAIFGAPIVIVVLFKGRRNRL